MRYSSTPLILTLSCAIGGCTDTASEADLASTTQGISAGIPVEFAENDDLLLGPIMGRSGAEFRGHGSAAAITNRWVLTAAHSVSNSLVGPVPIPDQIGVAPAAPNDLAFIVSETSSPISGDAAEQDVLSRVEIHPSFHYVDHPYTEYNLTDGLDIAVVKRRNDEPFVPATFRRPFSRRDPATLLGELVDCYGFGNDWNFLIPQDSCDEFGSPCMIPSDALKRFRSEVKGYSRPIIALGTEPLPDGTFRTILSGDSGGPCIDDDGEFLGVHAEQEFPPSAQTVAGDASVQVAADWLDLLTNDHIPLRSDVDLDGRIDHTFVVFDAVLGTLRLHTTFADLDRPNLDLIFPAPFGFPAPNLECFGAARLDPDGDLVITLTFGTSAFVFRLDPLDPTTPEVEELPQSAICLTVEPFTDSRPGQLVGVDDDGMVHLFADDGGELVSLGTSNGLEGFDFDGDGNEDVAIVAPGGDGNDWESGTSEAVLTPGSVTVLFGSPDGQIGAGGDNVESLSYEDVTGEEPVLEGEDASLALGSSVGWGDVDAVEIGGRRADELLIGAPGKTVRKVVDGDEQAFERAGRAFLVSSSGSSNLALTADFFGDDEVREHQEFGRAVVVGDFNGDAIDDIAIGAPGTASEANVGVIPENKVYVAYGGRSDGIDPSNPMQIFAESDLLVSRETRQGAREIAPQLGDELATGDFNCDGFADLAIGAPTGRRATSEPSGGVVIVLFGGKAGLVPEGRQTLTQNSGNLATSVERRDGFGASLIAGNFDGDFDNGRGCVDLAVGAPNEKLGDDFSAGVVHVIPGGRYGLDPFESLNFDRGDVGATVGEYDRFGSSLGIADLNGDGFADLLAGSIGVDGGNGEVAVLRGTENGPVATENFLRQGSDGISGVRETPRLGDEPYAYVGAAGYWGDRFDSLGSTASGGVLVGASREGHQINPDANPGDAPDGTLERDPYTFPGDFGENSGIVYLIDLGSTGQVQAVDERRANVPGSTGEGVAPGARFGAGITQARPALSPVPKQTFVSTSSVPLFYQIATTPGYFGPNDPIDLGRNPCETDVFPPDDPTCNGSDDDCDGVVDDDFDETATCGVGACARTAILECVDGDVENGCVPGVPSPELVGNGTDDDCDGETDEFEGVANAGADVTVECTSAGAAVVTLDGSGSTEAPGGMTYSWSAPGILFEDPSEPVTTGTFPVGDTTATLTVSQASASDSDTVLVRVVDTAPPVLTAPPDVFAATCALVPLGQATAADQCGGGVSIVNNAPSSFKAGDYTVTWRAVDQYGNEAIATQNVTVGLGDSPSCCPVGTNIISGTSNNDTLVGTSGSDCILGKGAQDTLRGMGGNDFLSGGDGDDLLEGGNGSDFMSGGNGQDTLRGQDGNDTLLGGDGDDWCYGGNNDDVLRGGQGQDRLFGEAGNDSAHGESGDDTLEGGSGNDMLNGGSNHDTCVGGTGLNSFTMCETQR